MTCDDLAKKCKAGDKKACEIYEEKCGKEDPCDDLAKKCKAGDEKACTLYKKKCGKVKYFVRFQFQQLKLSK